MKTALQNLLEAAGYDCQSYSGRAMYGRRCLAVVLERGQPLGDFIADLLEYAEDVPDLDRVAQQMRGLCTDEMGLGQVFYWPELPYEEES